MERKFTDDSRLVCPPLADIILQFIRCTFACHNKFSHICALRTAYSLAQWMNFQFLTYSIQSALLSLHIIDVFQMTGLLFRTFFFNEQERMYFSVYLNGDIKPQVKICTSSGHVVLNALQWFILVTFKLTIIKDEVHELGDSRHTLSVYCGRYIRITSENTQVYLNKKDWSQLMDLASACRQTSDQVLQSPR